MGVVWREALVKPGQNPASDAKSAVARLSYADFFALKEGKTVYDAGSYDAIKTYGQDDENVSQNGILWWS